jgi:hypothetical protein
MGHFPVGMEYFPASKTKQFELIRNLIDEADYYVLVIGSRYGTINDDTGNSFTHDEFLYAKDTDKPILAFIQEQKASPNQEGTQDVIDKKLKSFIDEVEYKRTCCIWSDRTELLVDILTSLYAEFENHPQLGWAKNIAKGVKNVADVEVSSVPAEVKKTNVGVAWEKFSGFINFDTETLESIYKEVVNELNSQTYFTTVPLACITYVFAYLDNEETIELTEEVKTALLEGYHKTLSSIMYREDLYDARLSFLKTLNYQKEYGEELKKLNELIKAFREEYDRQWNSKSDKMTYALLHLTDENVNQLTDIQRGALPDHSTTYWWTSIFGGGKCRHLYESNQKP